MTGGIPLIEIPPSHTAHLSTSLAFIDFEDIDLNDHAVQEMALAEVRDAAGAAFNDLASQACSQLAEPPWFLIIRGLPPARATPILVAVSATLGLLTEPYRQPWSRVVRQIVPLRDRTVSGRVLNEYLHTDGTDWIRPNDYTCLFCVRPDQRQDGESRLLDIATLLAEADDRLVDRLAPIGIPWRIADELGSGVHWESPIDPRGPHIRWLRYTVDLAHEEGLAPLPKEIINDLLEFEQVIENCPGAARVQLKAGDLLLMDNGRSLHARTAIRDPAGSVRELRRTKVMRRAGHS